MCADSRHLWRFIPFQWLPFLHRVLNPTPLKTLLHTALCQLLFSFFELAWHADKTSQPAPVLARSFNTDVASALRLRGGTTTPPPASSSFYYTERWAGLALNWLWNSSTDYRSGTTQFFYSRRKLTLQFFSTMNDRRKNWLCSSIKTHQFERIFSHSHEFTGLP